MSLAAQWKRLQEVIDAADSFILTSHIYPEADSIGSEVALALHLRHLGKEVLVVNDGPTVERYEFLTRLFPSATYEDLLDLPEPAPFDIAVCLDVSSWDYTGRIGEWIQKAGTSVVAVDHHHAGDDKFGVLDIIMKEACSAGEVLYHYFVATDALITPAMAEALYASILFDTWGFRLSNTCNDTIRIAAKLLDLGANHRHVCTHLFEAETWARMHLLRVALGTLKRECDGRLAWLAISEDLFRIANAEFVDADGILDFLLALQGVEICAMFREVPGQGVKVTFRSKGRQDVGDLAETLGGGGRTTASGAMLPVVMHDAIADVLPRVYGLLGHRSRAIGLPLSVPTV